MRDVVVVVVHFSLRAREEEGDLISLEKKRGEERRGGELLCVRGLS